MQSGCPGPQRPGAKTLQRRHRVHLPKQRVDRSTDGPAPLPSPLGGRGSGNPLRLRPAHPAAPQRASSRPAGRARSAAADDPLPGPRQLNLQRTAGSEARPPGAGPAPLPRLLTVGAKGAARARGGGRGAPHSLCDPTPYSEPTEPRRLCLAGLSPARTLRQALPGERGRTGFWHRNCSQAGAASPPERGGASPPGASGPAPGLLAHPCGPAGPRLRPAPLVLTAVRIVPFQPPNSTEAQRI